jgi:hypothetical protein
MWASHREQHGTPDRLRLDFLGTDRIMGARNDQRFFPREHGEQLVAIGLGFAHGSHAIVA